ncbi:MAG: hypothetical protein LBI29_00950 [Rickettsiales bacterium]|jgi:hypothetical protein|nr:hypothetical protein [Rickettsiales bacterium]
MKKNFRLLAVMGALMVSAMGARAGLEGNLVTLSGSSESINFSGTASPYGAGLGLGYGYALNFNNFLVVPEASFGYTLNNYKDADEAGGDLAGIGQVSFRTVLGVGYDFGKGAILFNIGAGFGIRDKVKYLSAGDEKKALLSMFGLTYGASFLMPLDKCANLRLGIDVTHIGITKDLKDATAADLVGGADTGALAKIKGADRTKTIRSYASLTFNF